MGKLVNFIVFLLLILTGLLVVFYHFDLEIGLIRGKEIPFVHEIILGITGFIALLLVSRVVSKWSSFFFMRKITNFKWESFMSSERRQWVIMVQGMELLFLVIFGMFFLFFDEISFYMGFLLSFLAVEKATFILASYQNKIYKIGITSKAILYFDKGLHTTPFFDAVRIKEQSKQLYFEEKNGMVYKFPLYAVPEERQKEFKVQLLKQIETEKVIISMK